MRHNLEITASVLLIVGAIVLQGCGAFSSYKIDLPVPAEMPAAPVVGHGIAITVVRPVDARSGSGYIGRDVEAEPNALGGGSHIEVAYASAKGNIPVWIGNAFASGLENAGFRVDKAASLSAAATPLALTLTVKEVWVDVGMSSTSLLLGRVARARISITAELYNGSTRFMKRVYGGRFEEDVAFKTTDTVYTDVLEGALKNMLSKAIPDLAGVITRQTT